MIKDIVEQNELVNINDKEVQILKEHFPGCFKLDGSFDIEKFYKKVSRKIEISKEGYELEFLGKSYAKLLAGMDTTTIIKPDLEHNERPENKNSENVYISGDNLDALIHLLKSYSGMAKCIYIDPPYNTGSDEFIYNDKFAFTKEVLMEKLSVDEKQAERIVNMTNREDSSHSAWLTFMYPRLLLARDLLNNEGVIFISIDDNEQSNLKLICDEIFGEENFIAQVIVQSNKRGQTYKQLAKTHEYALVYTKNSEVIINELQKLAGDFKYSDDISEFSIRELRNRNPKFGRFNRPNLYYPIFINGNKVDEDGFCPVSLEKSEEYNIEVYPLNSKNEESCWRWGQKKCKDNNNENTSLSNLVAKIKTTGEYGIYEKYRKTTYKAKTIWFEEVFGDDMLNEEGDIWNENGVITEQGSSELAELGLSGTFDFPKPTYIINKMLMLGSNKDSLIIDFFSGSGTTANAVMQLNSEDNGNRRFIVVQLPEVLDLKLGKGMKLDKLKIRNTIDFLESIEKPHSLNYIGIERIKRAALKIKEETGADIDYGFKHYELYELEKKTLHKLDKFDINAGLDDSSILESLGKDAILTTWLIRDGYGFWANVNEVDLGGYKAYLCGRHL